MLKGSVLLFCVLSTTACVQETGPTKEQVKQALYDRYETLQGAAKLQRALLNEVAVGKCLSVGENYQCQIDNKALETSIPMVFAYDSSDQRWRFVRENR
jgi:hypothetical protein